MRTSYINLSLAVAMAALSVSALSAGDTQDVYGPVEGAEGNGEAIQFVPEGIPYPLVEAVSVSTRGHPLIERALADRRSREAQRRAARWQRFPSLSVEGLAVTQGNQIGAQNGLAANIILEQPLYTFGRINGSIDAATAALEASEYAVVETQVDLALQTVSAYYDLALTTEREEILKESLAQHKELADTISRRVTQEVSPQADLELARSRVAQLEQDLEAVNGARRTSLARLLELIGDADINLGGLPRLDPGLMAPDEETLVQAALECSPRIKGIKATQKQLEAQRRVAKSRLFPQLVGQASTNEITGARVGVTLRLQTGNGLSQFAAVDAAAADVVALDYEAAAAERQIRELVRSDYVTFESGRKRLVASIRATRSTKLVTESYKRQFIAGRRTWLDVMNAVREAMAADLTESEAEIAALASYSRLMVQSCYWPLPPLVMAGEN